MLVQIISKILEDTYTTDELAERIGFMREHYHKRAFTPSEADVSVTERFRGLASPYTLGILEHWDEAFATHNVPARDIYEALESIEEELSTIPSATIYLPIKFTPEYLAGFGKWFRASTHPNMLLSVRTDSRLAGGCGLVWNSVYHDFSLSYFVNKHKTELVTMVTEHINVR